MKSKTTKVAKRPTQPDGATKAAHRSEPSKQTARPAKRVQATAKQSVPPPLLVPVVPISKKRAVEALLRGPEGIGLTELMAATGWQAHSIRAALTGFRKSGCTIKRDRDESGTRYRIVEAA